MSWPLVIQRVVKRDIASAIRWYDRQRGGLGDEFKAELETALNRLECDLPLPRRFIRTSGLPSSRGFRM